MRCARRRTWEKHSLESAQRLALQNRALGAEFVQFFFRSKSCGSVANNLRICCVFYVERTQTSDGVAATTTRRWRCASSGRWRVWFGKSYTFGVALAQNLRRQRLNFSQNFRDFGARRAQHAFCLPIVRCARRQTWAKLSLESEQRLALQNRAPGAEFVQNFPFENLRIDCKHFANLLRF